jgi:hypothetical protein
MLDQFLRFLKDYSFIAKKPASPVFTKKPDQRIVAIYLARLLGDPGFFGRAPTGHTVIIYIFIMQKNKRLAHLGLLHQHPDYHLYQDARVMDKDHVF